MTVYIGSVRLWNGSEGGDMRRWEWATTLMTHRDEGGCWGGSIGLAQTNGRRDTRGVAAAAGVGAKVEVGRTVEKQGRVGDRAR